MKHLLVLFFMIVINTLSSSAKIWLVGPTRTYTMPSQVSTLVSDNDTVAIDSGTYKKDVAYWSANNLLFEGVGGMARLKSGGLNYGGKAIWVINGNNAVVQYIEFAECTCSDNNGAGIRQQGNNLKVSHCLFDNNQEGILAGDDTISDIVIEYTEFYNNGAGDGYSHNLYINHVHSLTFQYNYSHHANVGHELKSRAYNNYILYNRFADETTGTAIRDIDLPNGGLSIITGNEIEKGPNSQNSNVLEYGLEGLTNASKDIYLVNNTFINDKSTGSFLDLQAGTSLCKAYNNIFSGPGTILIGTATTIDTSHNWYVAVANAGFVNASGYDYHLVSSSGANNNGTNPGIAGSYSLAPAYEYVYPTSMMARSINSALDIGAHEYGTASVNFPSEDKSSFFVYPNPSNGIFKVEALSATNEMTIELFDGLGQMIIQRNINSSSNDFVFNLHGLPSGTYTLCSIDKNNVFVNRIIIEY